MTALSPGRLARWLVLGGFVLALFAASCGVPEFEFAPDGAAGAAGAVSVVGHCDNRTRDADEPDVDCGGNDCDPCALGRACQVGSDCINGECSAGLCQAAACGDGERNGSETDADCGGGECPTCATGKRCLAATDCESGVCSGGTCAAPTCGDRVKNGTETDTDCGGDTCAGCAVGRACVIEADCAAPMVDEDRIVCEDDVCRLVCRSGTADCNSDAEDGCEVALATSLDHCGMCAQSCMLSNASAANCSAGACGVETCRDGFADCNGDPEDGCEVELTSDPDNCGECGTTCSATNGTPSCSNSTCAIACDDGFDDCNDDVSDGCEANLALSVLHCSECNSACTPNPGESAACDGTECLSIACNEPTDCGGATPCGACDPDQACNDTLSTVTNCGGCGITCTTTNGTPACTDSGSGYACGVAACDQNATEEFADCDGKPGDCEIDVQSSRRHCGGCTADDANPGSGADCTAILDDDTKHVNDVSCDTGGCTIVSCTGNWADCDGDFDNGCEVDLDASTIHCGGCTSGPTTTWDGAGVNCTTEWANSNASCSMGVCQWDSCRTNFGDCANGLADGCETDLRSSAAHCGGCGQACLTNSVTGSNNCSNRVCVPVCTGNGENCDGNVRNGCENKDTDEQNCGQCGRTCNTPTGTSGNTCTGGSCNPTCSSSDYENCDGNGANGCENKQTDENYCGSCSISCDASSSANVSSNQCTSGDCNPSCSGDYRDCDGQPWDGCETDTRDDPDHCGGCNVTCGGTGANVASATCSSKTCNVTCSGSKCPDTSDPERPCSIDLGTVSNCGSCGDACPSSTGGTVFCDAGCKERFTINVVNDDTTAKGNVSTSVSHTLASGSGSGRMVVALMGSGTIGGTVTYNGTAMNLATSEGVPDTQPGGAHIFYLLNSQLPAPGTYPVVATTGNGYGGVVVSVIELTNVAQTAPTDTNTAVESTDCGPISLTTTANVSTAGSIIFASQFSQSDPGSTGTPVLGLTETVDAYNSAQATLRGGYRLADSDVTVGWNGINGTCWANRLVTATFAPRVINR